MSFPIKKLTKTIRASFLTLPLVFAANGISAAESLDDRIQKLENLVKELKQAKGTKKSSGKHTYKFGGFIKATAQFSDYSDGDLGANSGLRDFYIPSVIPVEGPGVEGESQDFDFSAKESRINFKSTHALDNGSTLTTFIEMDFLLPPGGNERVSNSYNPRLRHAFFKYDNWLFGQTWSTFQDVGALPESADFLGASEGIIFERQPMVRYTKGSFQIALENPESTIANIPGEKPGRIVTDDNSTPDLVLRYNHKANWGHISFAGLVRQLEYNNKYDGNGNLIDKFEESTSAFGVSVTGKFKVGAKDDIRFNFATGSGLGRYAGLNLFKGAVIVVDGDGNVAGLETIDSTHASVAYRHFWNNTWRSNFIYSTAAADNDTNLTGTNAIESTSSFQVNLLVSPAPKVTLGVGYLSAIKTLENNNEGELGRLIFTAKYAF